MATAEPQLRLARPPIIEAWIGFSFEPNPDKGPWETQANAFVDKFSREFPIKLLLRTEEIRVEERLPTGIPTVISGKLSLDRIRARNEGGTEWLQVGEDLLAYNCVRPNKDHAYPGYEELRSRAFAKLEAYIDCFHPSSIRNMALHYVDLIEIDAAGKMVQLPEFFRVLPGVPDETFSPLARFSLDLTFQPSAEVELLTLRFRDEPPDPVSGAFRFRMEWHVRSHPVDSLDPKLLRDRLDAMRARVRDCFKACFTEAGWKLFGPAPRGIS
jgi:uncharacterized protein (TIGR04255 family)